MPSFKSDADLYVALRAERKLLARDLALARKDIGTFAAGTQKQMKALSTSIAASFGGLALGHILVSSIQKIADFEFQMDKVAAVSRASASEVKQLEKNALELGASTKFTATEIGKMQEEIARLGFTTPKIIDTTDAIRKLATVADAELGESAQVMVKTLNAFNLSAKESERVANVMAEALSMTALDMEGFAVGMSYAATSGKTFGLTVEETAAMLGALVDSGIQAQKAGTGLRDIFADLKVKGITLQEAYDKVNKSSNKTATAFDLVGKTSMNQLIILAEQQDKVNKLTKAFSDENKELNKMVGIMEDNLLTDWKLFTSAIDGLIQKGGGLNDFFRGTIQNLTEMVKLIDRSAAGLKIIADFRPGGGDALKESLGVKDDTLLGMIKALGFENKSQRPVLGPVDGPANVDNLLSGLFPSGPSLPDNTFANLTIPPTAKRDMERVAKEASDDFEAAFIDPFSDFSVEEGMQMALDRMINEADNWAFKGSTAIGEGAELLEEEIGKMEEAFDWDFSQKIAKGRERSLTEMNLYFSKLDEMAEKAKKQGEEISSIIEKSLESGIAGIVEGLATGEIDNAFAAFFVVFGDGLKQMGAALIAQGIALKAAALAFDPATKIAAGIAAVAAGALISNAAKSMSKGVSGGGGGSSYGGFSGTATGQSIKVDVQGKIRGNDIVFISERQATADSRRKI